MNNKPPLIDSDKQFDRLPRLKRADFRVDDQSQSCQILVESVQFTDGDVATSESS